MSRNPEGGARSDEPSPVPGPAPDLFRPAPPATAA